jgi:spermidine synthase
VDAAIGIGLLAAHLHSLKRWEFSASVSAVALVFLVVTLGVHFEPLKMASGVYRHGFSTLPNAEVLYHQDGKTATIDLIRFNSNTLTISTNGKPDASVGINDAAAAKDEITQVAAAAVSLSLHPQARTAANIGMGSGMTTHTLLGVDSLENVDTIEIEDAIVAAARGFGKFVERAYSDPRSHIYIEDAKTFFSGHNARYDIIVSEPSNPWVSGVASLFSDEFYRHIARHLNEDGILVQWVQLYEMNLDLLSSVFKALAKHFSEYVVFNTDNTNVLIVSSNGRKLSHLDPWIFKQARLNQDMARVGIKTLKDLEIRRIGSKSVLQALFDATGTPANSDYFPYLSYHAPKSRYLQENGADLTLLHHAPIPVLAILQGQVQTDTSLSSPYPFFSFPASQHLAQQIANRILSGSLPESNSIPTDFINLLNSMEFELRDCSIQSPDEELVRTNLFSLAINTNPYLSVQELDRMWESLANQPCLAKFSSSTKAWLTLHHAIAKRDAAKIVEISTAFMETNTKELNQQEWEYLIANALSASLIKDGKQNTKLLLARLNELHPLKTPPLYLRLLLSLLYQV